MSDHNTHDLEDNSADSRADAFAAVSLILILAGALLFWISNQ